MNHISLFSGMGGFDLAAQWMGWQNIAHVEMNPFGRTILKHYWPEADSHEDITKTDLSIYRGKCDILTGGFPCQPFSTAGKRKGATDARYLWPEMCRAINEARPRYVVGENVTGICSMVFAPSSVKVESETTIGGQEVYRTLEAESVLLRIIEDFERIGYSVQPLVIPAAAVNAPHRRDRIWLLATENTNQNGWPRNQRQEKPDQRQQRHTGSGNSEPVPQNHGTTSNTDNAGQLNETSAPDHWADFPTQPPVCAGNDGLPTQLHGIALSKWRKESLKAAGNAIVPQVAYEIFKAIELLEKQP
jgi:DNA (cytosine-5)-methyltransferase 1